MFLKGSSDIQYSLAYTPVYVSTGKASDRLFSLCFSLCLSHTKNPIVHTCLEYVCPHGMFLTGCSNGRREMGLETHMCMCMCTCRRVVLQSVCACGKREQESERESPLLGLFLHLTHEHSLSQYPLILISSSCPPCPHILSLQSLHTRTHTLANSHHTHPYPLLLILSQTHIPHTMSSHSPIYISRPLSHIPTHDIFLP